jgi:succinoglycan biosynthesis protein ExoU
MSTRLAHGFGSHPTAVIITAKDAAATIGKAVASALAQGPAAEVIVVDDGSSDDTLAVARSADDASGRLKTFRFERNRGPSAGRNAAIDASQALFLCILDADDFLGPGRLERMYALGGEDWDLLADDMFFAGGPGEDTVYDRLLADGLPLPAELSLSEFALGNLPARGRSRRELGFLKPVVRRALIERLGVRYDEGLRLGEDFIFYGRCLAGGGRFRLVEACGYYAVQSQTSLSARHGAADLEALHHALLALEREARERGRPAPGLIDYARFTRDRAALRRLLEAKRDRGLKGLAEAFRTRLSSAPYVVREVARAKVSGALARLRA